MKICGGESRIVTVQMIDIRDADNIEVSISYNGTVWVNGPDGACLLRAVNCKKVHLFDDRKPSSVGEK